MNSAKLTLEERLASLAVDPSTPVKEEYSLGSRIAHFRLSEALDAVLTATNGDVAAALSLIVSTRLKGVPEVSDTRLGHVLSQFLLDSELGIVR